MEFLTTGHEQTKSHGLGVAVGKAFVGGVGEQDFAPVGREFGEGLAAEGELLGDFIAEQTAEAGADAGEFLGRARRDGFPAEEFLEETEQAGRGLEPGAGGFDVAEECDDGIHEFAVLPKAEGIAVGVEEVRQGMELLPLRLVVRVFEFAGVRAFAGGLEFDEADKRSVNRNCVVGTGLQSGERRLADRSEFRPRDMDQLRKVREQPLDGGAQLVFRLAAGGGVGQLGFGGGTKLSDAGLNSQFRFHRQRITILPMHLGTDLPCLECLVGFIFRWS